MQTFFKRLTYIFESQGFKNLNDFALNGLKYESSSKLNRLKDENNKPSIEILLDISNKFQNINLDWLITGRGNFELNKINQQDVEKNQHLVAEPTEDYKTDLIESLKEQVVELRKDKELLRSLLENKMGNAKMA